MAMFIIVALILMAGCGSIIPEGFESLTAMQPAVESVMPADGSIVAPDSGIDLRFTRAIEKGSVDESTLAIVRVENADGRDDLVEDVVDGGLPGVEGQYAFADGDRRVTFQPAASLEEGARYLIVASPRILGEDLLPLNQNPGGEPAPFVSEFAVAGGGVTGSGGVVDGSGEETVAERIRPAFLMINEILYDAAGSDSNGDVFVELYGEAGGDITGYEIVFVNGEDGVIKDTIEIPEDARVPDDGIFVIADAVTGSPGTSHVEGADHIVNFDPQNGPDCLQLVSEEGELIDAMGYGEPIVDPAENGLSCFEGSLAVDVGSGQSLSREFGLDLDDNALDFFAISDPTPGVL